MELYATDFWRRHPKWRAIGDIRPGEIWNYCEQEVVGRVLRRRVGMARLSVSLFVGLADVTLQAEREDTPFVEDYAGVAHCSWILSDVPTDFATLQAEVASVLTQCGCGRARHLSALIVEELTRLVTNACADRESRLSMLPTAAPFRWNELPPTHRGFGTAFTRMMRARLRLTFLTRRWSPEKSQAGDVMDQSRFSRAQHQSLVVQPNSECHWTASVPNESCRRSRRGDGPDKWPLRLAVPSRYRRGLTGSRCWWKDVDFMKAGLA